MSFFLIFTKAFCLLCIAHAVAGGLDDKKEFNKHHVFLCYIFGVGGLFFDYFSIVAMLFFIITGQFGIMWKNRAGAIFMIESFFMVLFTPKIKFFLWIFAVLLGLSAASRAFGVFYG